jgi:subfamily B ATP-binding cassette protein MsbA
MIGFLRKLWDLTQPYRGRLLLAILTGVIGGLLEPAMVATVMFVYGLIFPSADVSSLLSNKSFRDAPVFVTTVSKEADPVSQFLWQHFSPEDRTSIATSVTVSNDPPALLLQGINHVLQCEYLYDSQRFAGVRLSVETQAALKSNPQGEALIRLNRLLLEDAYHGEVLSVGAAPLAAKLWWAPAFVRDIAIQAQAALASGVKSNRAAIAALVALIPTIILLRGIFSYLNVYLLQWVSIRAITDLRTRLFAHIMNMPAAFFSGTNTGQLMARIMADTGTLQSIISNATTVMVKDPVTLVSMLAWLMWNYTTITLISLIVMPICMVPIVVYGQKVRRSSRALQTHAAELSMVMAESFSGNRVVRAYNLEAPVIVQFRTIAGKFIGHYMRIVRSMELPGPLLEFVGSIGLSLVLVYLVVHQGGRPTSADFLAVIMAIFAMYRPLKNLTRLHNTLEQGRAASEKVFALLATSSTIPEPAQPKPLKAAGVPIRFEHVSFSYADRPILQDFNLTVEPGQFIGLVGESGSGKTTVANLLLRFYDPQQGAIRIGDVNIRDVTTRELREQIAMVTQETILFNQTIAANIELGRPGAPKERVIEAARRAHASEFILEKPEGFETIVGEKGVLISGGQRQRIAIARAILRDAPILILDEATSALDAVVERALQADLEELMKGRTTICIAHRLSTVQNADLILVMNAGKVAELGTHAQLLARKGIYYRLYRLQSDSPADA